MASKSKKKSTSKKTTGKTTKKAGENFVIDEIIIWIVLAVSILLLISNFGFGGTLGASASAFLMESFGAGAYLVPFLLFGVTAFLVSNKHNRIAYWKSGAAVICFLILCGLFELISDAGGTVGGSLADILSPALGVAGTYVILIIMMIIGIVIITGRSVLKGVKKQSDRAYSHAKESNTRRREASARRREERRTAREEKELEQAKAEKKTASKRKDRHVEGVSFDTTLSGRSPEMKEMKADELKTDIPSAVQPNTKDTQDLVINRTQPEMATQPDDLPDPFDTDSAVESLAESKALAKRSRKKAGADAIAQETASVAQSVSENEVKNETYHTPPFSLLTRGKKGVGDSDTHLRETAGKLQDTLHSFGVNVTVTNVSCGPSVTRYELQPEQGVKVSKIVGLADDIKLNLATADIRIEAPIPGKAAVGIEVPNKENSAVMLRDLLESTEFKNSASNVSFAVGRDIAGRCVVADIAKMPHLLIAGATGSGKSVCINTLIMSILYKASPDQVRLIMVDPKVVELSVYNGIPHLMIPVVTDPKKAAGALNWAVAEMTRRYQAFAEHQVRDMKGYNEKVSQLEPDENGNKPDTMPQIVIIVDELADLMMVAPGEVEESICRLAQLARAAGIHLVLATQRPSVNVITGLIKANMPSRIAFSVSSGVDSRTIIDMNGAEKLLGKGDMLFYPSGYQKPIRVQGAFVSDKEVQKVTDYLKDHNGDAAYSQEVVEHMNSSAAGGNMVSGSDSASERDAYFVDAGKLIIDKEKASIGMLQRMFKIGFNRAARIMDQLCEAGVVGPEEGTKPRKVLMSMEEFEHYIEEYI
ncbi:MAG: DNA translocase FtsK 4TM domain-containing protein [Lachnospiraceae bacterium]|nr:DNA translocase FtsK 4TM domain-containing protein [Lachnospiraceae bacterium]